MPKIRKTEKPDTGIIEKIEEITDFVSSLVKEFAPHLHVRLTRIHVKVATPDAAQTAILYGVISSSLACLIDLIDDNVKLHRLSSRSIIVEPDFLSEKCEARINISFGLSVLTALKILIKLAWTSAAKKYKKKNIKPKGI